MKAQRLNPEKSKTLLLYLTSHCSDDIIFKQGIHAGLRYIEKTGDTPSGKEVA
jgi:hypothetical protein